MAEWMTSKDDIMKLGGRLLTKAVAEVVMGWRFQTLDNGYGHPADYWTDIQGKKVHPANFWNPATDLKDAWEVMEKLQQKWSWDMRMLNGAQEIDVRIGRGYATSKSVPEAICKAAILTCIRDIDQASETAYDERSDVTKSSIDFKRRSWEGGVDEG